MNPKQETPKKTESFDREDLATFDEADYYENEMFELGGVEHGMEDEEDESDEEEKKPSSPPDELH